MMWLKAIQTNLRLATLRKIRFYQKTLQTKINTIIGEKILKIQILECQGNVDE